MNRELMNTFTHEQLLMCEKENLLDYINEIKEHHEIVVCELKEKHETVISELFKQIGELKSPKKETEEYIRVEKRHFDNRDDVCRELVNNDLLYYQDHEYILNPDVMNKLKHINHCPPVLSAQWDKKGMVLNFIHQRCYESPAISYKNGTKLAPTCFIDFYFEFKCWCQEQGYKSPEKKQVKIILIDWNMNFSGYGWKVGDKLKDGCPNGTLIRPYFNLTISETMD